MKKKPISTTPPASQPHMPSEPDLFGLERLVFFSDAVFAIAITLLALEIRLPTTESALTDAELLQNLQAIGQKYLAYILSFLVIGVFWIGHHRRYRFIQRYDSVLLFLNLLLLMIVAFIPFPTAIISDHGTVTATVFYALTMILAGLVAMVTWWYASHHHRLIDPHMSSQQIRGEFLSILSTPVIFLLSIGIAFISSDLARLSWILIAPARLIVRTPDKR